MRSRDCAPDRPLVLPDLGRSSFVAAGTSLSQHSSHCVREAHVSDYAHGGTEPRAPSGRNHWLDVSPGSDHERKSRTVGTGCDRAKVNEPTIKGNHEATKARRHEDVMTSVCRPAKPVRALQPRRARHRCSAHKSATRTLRPRPVAKNPRLSDGIDGRRTAFVPFVPFVPFVFSWLVVLVAIAARWPSRTNRAERTRMPRCSVQS
jgi:hypothetical protein